MARQRKIGWHEMWQEVVLLFDQNSSISYQISLLGSSAIAIRKNKKTQGEDVKM